MLETTNNLDATTPGSGTGSGSSTGLSLNLQVLTLDESFHRHVARGYWQWRDLFERDPQARIEQHPDQVLVELSFAQQRDSRPAFLIQAQQGESTVAAAILVPKEFGDSKKFGPRWKLRGYRLVGNQLIGLCDPDTVTAMLKAAREVLAQQRADFLMLEDVETDSPLQRAVLNGTSGMRAFHPAPFQPRHRIQFQSNATDSTPREKKPATLSCSDAYWGKFSSKTRGKLRRRVKQFENARLERITQTDQVADFLAHAHEISKQSWQSELLGLRIRNDDRELQMLTTLAMNNALRSYLLWQGDEPVSFCIGTQHNGVFMDEEVGFDRRKAALGPGQVQMTLLIDDLLAHDTPHELDFGFGDAEYKALYGTHVSSSGPIWLLRPGLKSTLMTGYINGRRALVQGLRGMLVKTGMLQWVKQRLKRGSTSATAELKTSEE